MKTDRERSYTTSADFPGHVILLIGIACVGALLGYMVGGSATPVVKVAIPAVFGLVVTALGIMQASRVNKDILELVKTHGERAATIPEIMEFRQRSKRAPVWVGATLIVFATVYLAAATFGAEVRINKWLEPRVAAPAFPWTGSTRPPTISSALEWVALQGRLHDLGYEDARIRELYDIQVQEWKAQAQDRKAASEQLSPRKTGQPVPDTSTLRPQPPGIVVPGVLPPGTTIVLPPQPGGGAPPFTNNQPPPGKELIDRLDKMRRGPGEPA